MAQNKIFIADGLHIHCEKKSNVFLNIIAPLNQYRFCLIALEDSIIESLSK